jgi:hypothetical protein
MAALRAAVRALRLDPGTWRWLDSDASLTGAALVVIGTYLMLAFDRFGWPDFAIRPTTRAVLIGFYGWIWLAVASWAIVRRASVPSASLSSYLRLTGHAHFPILVVAAFLLVFAVTLNVAFIGRWPTLFAGVVWMPAMLASVVSTLSGLSLGRAALVVALPYAAWVAVVGTHMFRQVEHLL